LLAVIKKYMDARMISDKSAIGVFILNISQNETTVPTKETIQCVRNFGLYEGSAAKCSSRDIRHMAP